MSAPHPALKEIETHQLIEELARRHSTVIVGVVKRPRGDVSAYDHDSTSTLRKTVLCGSINECLGLAQEIIEKATFGMRMDWGSNVDETGRRVKPDDPDPDDQP